MCGPYGHAHVTEERQDDWDDDGTSNDPALLSPRDGDGPMGAAMDQLDEMIDRKPERKRLPSDRMLLAGYPWLNSHGEISLGLPRESRIRGELIPCGFDLANGELLLQRNRGHHGLPLTVDDLKEAKRDWIRSIRSAGGIAEFLLAHAGRLGDLAQWIEKFPQMLEGRYALHQMKGRVNKQRFQQWQADVITSHAIKGVWQHETGVILWPSTIMMGRATILTNESDEDVQKALDAIVRKHDLERKLNPALRRLWGRNAYEAAETLCEHANEFVATMN